jgi:hypothetical protein
MLLRGAGLGYLPRYLVQGCWTAASWLKNGARAIAHQSRGWAGMTPPRFGERLVAGKILANSAIHTIYILKSYEY